MMGNLLPNIFLLESNSYISNCFKIYRRKCNLPNPSIYLSGIIINLEKADHIKTFNYRKTFRQEYNMLFNESRKWWLSRSKLIKSTIHAWLEF